MTDRAADDFTYINRRMNEISRTEGRAGNVITDIGTDLDNIGRRYDLARKTFEDDAMFRARILRHIEY